MCIRLLFQMISSFKMMQAISCSAIAMLSPSSGVCMLYYICLSAKLFQILHVGSGGAGWYDQNFISRYFSKLGRFHCIGRAHLGLNHIF